MTARQAYPFGSGLGTNRVLTVYRNRSGIRRPEESTLITAGAPGSAAFGTPVTSNANAGLLTYTSTLAAATSATSVVNDSKVTANSLIFVCIQSYSGTYFTNGIPIVAVQSKSAGTSFTIVLNNTHAANALSGTLTIAYHIIN